jgi:hypothetical protein
MAMRTGGEEAAPRLGSSLALVVGMWENVGSEVEVVSGERIRDRETRTCLNVLDCAH